MNEPCPKCGEYHNQCFELKQLTDEEIREVAEGVEYESYAQWKYEFARAILRKAQEK